MRITLLRHGKPEFVARSVGPHNPPSAALQTYESSDVQEPPPASLQALSKSPGIFCVTSQLKRARSTARLLTADTAIATELLNESELPHPKRLYIPLPWNVFLLIYRLLWLIGYRRNCPGRNQDQTRARLATEYLVNQATLHNSVLAVGHGIMNRMISNELRRAGWVVVEKNGTGYWSVITLQHHSSCQHSSSGHSSGAGNSPAAAKE